MSPLEPTRRRAAATRFEPRFTLGLLYFVALFFAFSLALVAPSLLDAFRELPPGPAERDLELAARVAQDAARGRLWLALLAAAVTTALGARAGLLPGLRPRV